MATNKRNKLEKPSKNYIFNVLLFAANNLAIILLIVFVILAYTVIRQYIPDSILNVPFSLIGFLLPVDKYLFDRIRDSLPWETTLRSAINKKQLKKDDEIRISYSYFLVVEVNGKYLLRKNTHGLETYTLPAYTYPLSLEKKEELDEEFGIRICNYFQDKDWYDYRLYIKANKLKKFYRQFLSDVDPYNYDYSPLKEIIVEGLNLDKEIFKNAKIDFNARIIPQIKYSRKIGTFEMYVQDRIVFSPTEEQFAILKELIDKELGDFRFVSLEIIKNNGADESIGKFNNDIPDFVYDEIVYRNEDK